MDGKLLDWPKEKKGKSKEEKTCSINLQYKQGLGNT